jgi:hypothetical protein
MCFAIGGKAKREVSEEYEGTGVSQIEERLGGGNSTVESHSSKVMVAGSNPVPRSKKIQRLEVRRGD